ncbi:MAG: GGDEF domain-containing protein [Spirochaetales bacterium]|nr:GGDEF domain-containing protein [Spirochaetales bacterium]
MSDNTYVLYYSDKKIILSINTIYKIGRSPDNDILLDEKTVSRNHARLMFRDNRWIIEDLESSNGTLINYEKKNRVDLQDGDRISIGPFHCMFRVFNSEEIPEYDTLVSDTLILEKKIQDIFHLLPTAESRNKMFDLKHFINSVRQKMNTAAIQDRLTGIYNRAYFDDCLAREIARAKRYNLDLCLIIGDIDHFKRVNDTYGHQKGDEVLSTVAAIIRESTRVNDIVARYGGEELAIILPQSTPELAHATGEKICRKIELQSKERTGIRVTMSCGIASAKTSGFNPEKIINQADMALYRAKKQGRNRIFVYK